MLRCQEAFSRSMPPRCRPEQARSVFSRRKPPLQVQAFAFSYPHPSICCQHRRCMAWQSAQLSPVGAGRALSENCHSLGDRSDRTASLVLQRDEQASGSKERERCFARPEWGLTAAAAADQARSFAAGPVNAAPDESCPSGQPKWMIANSFKRRRAMHDSRISEATTPERPRRTGARIRRR